MKKKIHAILKIVTTVLIGAVVVFVVLLVGVRLFGLKVYTVLSSSMEPGYPTGSVIYVKGTDPAEIEAGDVITYYLTGTTVSTHRVVEVLEEDGALSFRTKGDANDHADAQPVSSDSLIGTPVFTVSGLGYAAQYVRTPPGSYFAIACGSLLILLSMACDALDEKKKSGAPEEQEDHYNTSKEEKDEHENEN